MKGKVAVLAGGRSPEREVSLLSGHRVRNALLATGWDAATVDPAEALVRPAGNGASLGVVSKCSGWAVAAAMTPSYNSMIRPGPATGGGS